MIFFAFHSPIRLGKGRNKTPIVFKSRENVMFVD